ncbi:discoidin domain-containing protein [Tessaracoccus sp. OS52]|uniref:discoidin domain-containing protein n=1 Tax=Tessaracoccus sp. OS52 TaxID=2886691 RepID=UPI001D0FE061|nr:discoidin domain-containing protein [Tessaracoccus sp. OS52]MCC2594631.1 discoidin domain-containing protein [Tessaracoccus sp. OS52]
MPNRLPDEFFREQASQESVDVGQEKSDGGTEQSSEAVTPRRPFGRGVAPRLVVAGVLGALLLGFGIGRLLMLGGDGSPQATGSGSPSVSQSSSPTSSTSTGPTLVPYDGPVRNLAVLDARGACRQGPTNEGPDHLLDGNPNTIWRCEGSGVDEELTFTLDPSQPVVGVRLVNGNTVRTDAYLAERRVLSVKWTFSDGSWTLQGLAANDRLPQEVRFPPVKADWVKMTILDVTVTGATDPASDAVSISALDFLTTA